MKKTLTLIATFALLAATPVFAASTGAEIKAALVGNTFQGGMGGGAYASYFAEDGSYKDKTGGGKYTIEGDAVCYPGTDFGCYRATIKGDTLEWSKDGKSEGSGSILKGNPLNL